MTWFRRAPGTACSAALVWLALAACGGDGGVDPRPAVVAAVALAAADAEPEVGASVAVTAHARDASGSPIPGVRIDFAPGGSSGTVAPYFGLTDADGAVSTTWTVSTVAGPQSLAARAGNVGDTLVVTVTAGAPESAAPEGEADFDADPGDAVPVAVVVRDRWGNPVPRVSVVFDVVTGAGSANPTRVQTDVEGRAASTWMLGPDGGMHRLLVRAADLEVLAFTARVGVFWIRGAVQERWPESDEITLWGAQMDSISAATVLVNGGPPRSIVVVSPTRAVIHPWPLSGAQAQGCAPHRAGELAVVAPPVRFSAAMKLLHGPLVALDVGQELRLSGNEHCLRLRGESGLQRYVLAAVERSYIDAARTVSEEWHYNGGEPFELVVADSTAPSAATAGLVARIEPPPQDPFARRPDHVRVHPPTASQRLRNVWTRTVPYEVGNEFDWYTGDGRDGTFKVMALYPPNFVLAVFKEDLPTLWSDRRALAMDSLFQDLGSPRIQELYRTVFGDGRAQTSPATGQMLFMFHDGPPAAATGVTYSAPNFRETTIHFRRVGFRDDNSWYYSLVAHELGHAWQNKAIGRMSAVWSGEGIASWIADERLRLVAGLDLDANHMYGEAIQGWRLRMPETGDFVAGYRESHPFIRFLVTRLVLDHGQSYDSAVRRVVTGVSEGWWGHHFVNWDVVGYDGGLVNRMREVVPNWDPVEARLDWMVSIALDDRSNLPGYRIPFVRGASASLRPLLDLRLGRGSALHDEVAGGGNYYFMVRTSRGTSALHLLASSDLTEGGPPTMAWKLVRWR